MYRFWVGGIFTLMVTLIATLLPPAAAAEITDSPSITIIPDTSTSNQYAVILRPGSDATGAQPILYDLKFSVDQGQSATPSSQTIDADHTTGVGKFAWNEQVSRSIQNYSCPGGCPNSMALFIRVYLTGYTSGGTVFRSAWSTWVAFPTFTDDAPNPIPSPIPTPEPTPAPPPPSLCPSVQFVGVRGSGETREDSDGYGRTIEAVRFELSKLVPNMTGLALDYQAIAIQYADPAYYGGGYISSVGDGIAKLQKYTQTFVKRCETTPLVLVGYSQGAHVVGDVIELLTTR